MKKKLLYFCAIMALVNAKKATDYCKRICYKKDHIHIGCKPKGTFAESCHNAKMINMDKRYQKILLNAHNSKRNMIAGGGAKQPIACRMATMQWDEELEKLASYNVQKCIEKHDYCHDTDKFPESGQNILVYPSFSKNPRTAFNVSQTLERTVNGWFREIKDWNITNVDCLEKPADESILIGHYSVIVHENNTHLGCAAGTYFQHPRSFFHIVCNYAVDNFLGSAVYHHNCKKPGNYCPGKKKNPSYPNLCAIP